MFFMSDNCKSLHILNLIRYIFNYNNMTLNISPKLIVCVKNTN